MAGGDASDSASGGGASPYPLTAEQLARVKELFLRASELATGERDAFVAESTVGEPEIAQELRRLLAGDLDGSGLGPVEEAVASALGDVGRRAGVEAPQTVGPYRIVRLLGEGGMGSVYEAEQSDPIRRSVALKLIRPGLNSEEVRARFDSERRALALMDHPNIARVLSAGATEDGRPYFAMELIEGPPITDFCDERGLGVRGRLELFRTVCEAVEHAHQRGVLHRDIKPSNVLVTEVDGRPIPKIIDFGVARASAEEASQSGYTRHGEPIGTLKYMSPEQAGVVDAHVDGRADVYSLGALLYQLLVGEPPFAGQPGDGWIEFAQRVREETPERPSTRVSRERAARLEDREPDPRALKRSLEGDLDWITMKALEKDLDRRYGSPADLAASVSRHLRDEPVRAGPPTLGYLARKFLLRHRIRVLLAAMTLALVSSLIAIVSLFADHRRLAETARQASERSEELTGLVAQAVETFEEWSATEEPNLTAELAAAPAAGPGVLERRLSLAQLHIGLGQLHRARELIDAVHGDAEARSAAQETDLRGRLLWVEGRWLMAAGRPTEAAAAAREAVGLFERNRNEEWGSRSQRLLEAALRAAEREAEAP